MATLTLQMRAHIRWWAPIYHAACIAAVWCAAPFLSEARLDRVVDALAGFYARRAVRVVTLTEPAEAQ